jgi:hypothetical protein
LSGGLRLETVEFFGRTLEECLEMFAVSLESLREGRTLDCPSGPDSFVAEACEAGCDVVGLDPRFTASPAELRAIGTECLARCERLIRDRPESLTFRDRDGFLEARRRALARFLTDYEAHRHDGRYVAASLPTLPFPDRAFDRVFAANFLFSYAPTQDGGLYAGQEFDLAFHLRSIEEIARVADREIRLAPMGSFDPPPRPHGYRDPVMKRLQELGFAVELVPSRFDSGLSAFNDVLVARRPD